jgi:3-oxoacyl-[acyl-carrier-protein] synthase III
MKRPFFPVLTAGVLGASLTAGAFADSPRAGSQQVALIATLEQRAQRLEQHVQTTTGGGRQVFEIQRRQVQHLIARIKAGEAVDPHEIDMLLRTGPQ